MCSVSADELRSLRLQKSKNWGFLGLGIGPGIFDAPVMSVDEAEMFHSHICTCPEAVHAAVGVNRGAVCLVMGGCRHKRLCSRAARWGKRNKRANTGHLRGSRGDFVGVMVYFRSVS